MKDKKDEERATDLLQHLDGDAFDFYFDNFAEAGILKATALDYEKVKKAIIDNFA